MLIRLVFFIAYFSFSLDKSYYLFQTELSREVRENLKKYITKTF